MRKGHGAVLTKARFWQHWADLSLNELQVKRINPLLDGFDGTWTVSKWAAIDKCAQDTALRDITEWLVLGVLQKPKVGGRSTRSPVGAAPLTRQKVPCSQRDTRGPSGLRQDGSICQVPPGEG